MLGVKNFSVSGVGSDNKHAHPDTIMKRGRNVHKHELLEFFSLANQNWSIFKMAALKSQMAAAINVKSLNEDLTSYKEIKKKHLKWYYRMKYIIKG